MDGNGGGPGVQNQGASGSLRAEKTASRSTMLILPRQVHGSSRSYSLGGITMVRLMGSVRPSVDAFCQFQ